MTTLSRQTVIITPADDARFLNHRLGIASTRALVRTVTDIETVDQYGGLDEVEGNVRLAGRKVRVVKDYDGTWSISEAGGWVATR